MFQLLNCNLISFQPDLFLKIVEKPADNREATKQQAEHKGVQGQKDNGASIPSINQSFLLAVAIAMVVSGSLREHRWTSHNKSNTSNTNHKSNECPSALSQRDTILQRSSWKWFRRQIYIIVYNKWDSTLLKQNHFKGILMISNRGL